MPSVRPLSGGRFHLETPIKLPPVGTRLRLPSGRCARISSYDRDGFVTLHYYDGDGDDVTFAVSLLNACDVITPPKIGERESPRSNHG